MSVRLAVSLAVRKLATAWFCLALAALGFSVVAAAIPVVARTPFLGQGGSLIGPAQALHAMLAMPVWMLGMAAGILTLSTSRAGLVAWGSWWLALAGMAALLVSPWLGGGLIPNPYLPMLDNPLFLGGAGTFGLAIGLIVLRNLSDLRRLANGPPWIVVAWVVPALAATLALPLAAVAGTDTVAGLSAALWGVGHAFQFVVVLLLLAAWVFIAGKLLSGIRSHRRVLHLICGFAALPIAGCIALAFAFPADSTEYREGVAWLMRWTSWPAAALLAVLLTVQLVLRVRQHPLTTEQKGLALSLLLFAAGACAMATIHGDSGPLSAQLHGTAGATTLAFLLCWHRLIPGLPVAESRLVGLSRIAVGYGLGMLVFVAASGVAFGLPDASINAGATAYLTAMGMAGIGGIVAIGAVAAYIANGVSIVLNSHLPGNEVRRDIRPWAITATLLLVLGGGWLLQSIPRSGGTFAPHEHAAQQLKADIDTRFQQGVVMLHAKQYEHALTAFHRVLQLAPEMPEAYVNMGFTLIGLKRYKEAGDFFESATQLRPNQVNAYYGLAVALEGMGDLRGALEAMEAYVHLTNADDPFLPKARAAIWEWRSVLDSGKVGQAPVRGKQQPR